MQVQKLKTDFVKQGFKYTQVKRSRHLAIYHQQLIRGRAQYWEVWIIQVREPGTIGEKMYPRMETAPSPNKWGVSAWTFYTLEAAQFRFDELLQIQKYADGIDSPEDASPNVSGQPGLPKLVPGNNGFSLDPPL